MKKTALLMMVTLLCAAAPMKSVYDFTMKDIDGKNVSLASYKGKVLLIVNVASHCGNTPQYKDIEALYEKYKDNGLVALGFPENDFMGQEPGTNAEIKTFCTSKYDVKFPMFSKISVKGKEIAPLYTYLTKKDENGVLDAPIQWNFQKFLIAKDGKVITTFAPKKQVTDPEVVAAIEKALKQ